MFTEPLLGASLLPMRAVLAKTAAEMNTHICRRPLRLRELMLASESLPCPEVLSSRRLRIPALRKEGEGAHPS